MFLASNKIKVYPSGYRGESIDTGSFVNTEENLNDIAGRLVSNKSYIVDDTTTTIRFVVKGYLFSAEKSDITGLVPSPSEDSIIYANISVANISGYNTLVPFGSSIAGLLDTTNGFEGVDFSTTSSSDCLPLFKYEDNVWKVIEDSKMTFSTERIQDADSGKCIHNKFSTNEAVVQDLKATKLTVTGSASNVILPDSSINTNEIEDRAITTDKIADNAVTKDKLATDVFMAVFPVGSIYMSVNSTNPSELFPGTEWSQIQGQFLLGAGTTPDTQNTYTVNTSGGNASYTFSLTESNLPAHSHSYSGSTGTNTYTIGKFGVTGNTGWPTANHGHTISIASMHAGIWDRGSNDIQYLVRGDSVVIDAWTDYGSGGVSENHFHYVDNAKTDSKNYTFGGFSYEGNTGSIGSGSSITIPTLPPYLVVYMWQRTA